MAHDRLQILVVDDCDSICRLLTAWLEDDGFDVRSVGSAEEAQESIQGLQPHILITDWLMPGISGPELCAWVRKQNFPRYLYMIVLTSVSGSQSTVEALDAGADDFVRKPVDRAELLARIHAGVRLVELEEKISRAARYDSLTGVLTRHALFDQLDREWSRCRRHHIPLSCVMLDVDYFKRINDTFGHPVGDDVLRRVAQILRSAIRESDLVGRYGGEEFCIILPETDENSATMLAERLRVQVSQATDLVGDVCQRVTVSLGIAERLVDSKSPEELIDLADQALLVAKRSGRDRSVGYRSIGDVARTDSTLASPQGIFQRLMAKDVMTSIVSGLREHDTVDVAAKFFLRFRFNSAPVVDERGRLVGILSERDLLAIMLWPRWWTSKIHEVMKRNVVCYDESTPISVIYDFLCRVAIRAVVITRGGEPVGMISRGSVLRWFVNRLAMFKSTEARNGLEIPALDQLAEPKESVLRIIQLMETELHSFSKSLESSESGNLPQSVSRLTRVEELLNSLFSYCRQSDKSVTSRM